MGNGSKIKQHKSAFLKGQCWVLLCRPLCISSCSSPASPDARGCKWSWGGRRTSRFEQGWDKKNIEEDNGFSPGTLNLTWTLPCREMKPNSIFMTNFVDIWAINDGWKLISFSLAQAQLPIHPGVPVQSTEVVRAHFLWTAQVPAGHQPSGNAERSGDDTLSESCYSNVG